MQLTKDTDKMLCFFYEEYLTRRKSGIEKSQAKEFDSPDQLITQFMQGTLPNDIFESLYELRKHNLIKLYVDGGFTLRSEAIVYMENRFKNGLIEIADFIAKFIP